MSSENRCAIYTRKSSEEGLEQSFNSLDAQREACIAYIRSQKHEGWVATAQRYDDGGFSGGNMERPGLNRLLAGVQAGKIATVVVYKVDRLTRSLSDFAKIIEIFDKHKVSFVSVTQQFNTTTSMGRLTLNVLLSFAQFERELTGERIRDKVAASKKKGMWMGGVVPLGYDCVDHQLVINAVEAETVRAIFRHYLRLGCVSKLKGYLEAAHVHSKVRLSASGRKSGGACYSRGALYHLLNNRIYIGQIVHGGQVYPGQHKPIIERKLWDRVAARLQANNQAHRQGKSRSTPSLLTGIIRDNNGVRFTPTHSLKNGKRYRYYTSQALIQRRGNAPAVARIPAPDLERLVVGQIIRMLESPGKYIIGTKTDPQWEKVVTQSKLLASQWSKGESQTRDKFLKDVLESVFVGHKTVTIHVNKPRLIRSLLGHAPVGATGRGTITLAGKFQLSAPGKPRIYVPESLGAEREPVPSLVKAIARAHAWCERLHSGGMSVEQLAAKTRLSSAYIQHILPCGILSPRVVEAILSGRQRPHLCLTELLRELPTGWREQERKLLSVI